MIVVVRCLTALAAAVICVAVSPATAASLTVAAVAASASSAWPEVRVLFITGIRVVA